MKLSQLLSIRNFLIIMCLLMISGCAGTKIQDFSSRHAPANMAPQKVAVLTDVKLEYPPRHETASTQVAAAEEVKNELNNQLTAMLIAHRLTIVSTNNTPDLIIKNQIVDIRKGKRSLRLFVGYGAGRAELEVLTTVINAREVNQKPLLSFKTKSTTGGMPSSLIGGLIKSMKQDGIHVEASDTVKLIDITLRDYFISQNWNYSKLE